MGQLTTNRRKRLSPSQESSIIEAYQSWDGSETVDDFAQRQGISKQTLYGLLRRRGIRTRTQEAFMSGDGEETTGDVPGLADWLVDKVATQALKTILEENRKVHALESRIEELETALREAGIDPDSV